MTPLPPEVRKALAKLQGRGPPTSSSGDRERGPLPEAAGEAERTDQCSANC
jgi:hypothetical protein